MFDLLKKRFGPQHWWPGDTPLEIMVGAILVQNTNWMNVEKAITNLKGAALLSLDQLADISQEELAQRIRPAGYYNIKAKRLKNLFSFLQEQHDLDMDSFVQQDLRAMREGLLTVKGIGPETADSICLYAGEKPTFVIDTYTYRILTRHLLIDENSDYHEMQELFMGGLPEDVQLFNEFHALIVMTGKEFCKPRPLCDECPLLLWTEERLHKSEAA